jgi:hypothetical protein
MDEEGSGMVKPEPSQQSFEDRCDAEDDENFDQQKGEGSAGRVR